MKAKIQDLAAAAVVVSAMDRGNSSSRVSKSNVQNADAVTETSSKAKNKYRGYSSASNVAQARRDNPAEISDHYGNYNEINEEDRKALDGLNEEFVSEMTKELNELMGKLNCDLEFQYHKEVDVMSVRMVNKETNEVIKEYPPEEMIDGMIKAQEWLGAFLDKKA